MNPVFNAGHRNFLKWIFSVCCLVLSYPYINHYEGIVKKWELHINPVNFYSYLRKLRGFLTISASSTMFFTVSSLRTWKSCFLTFFPLMLRGTSGMVWMSAHTFLGMTWVRIEVFSFQSTTSSSRILYLSGEKESHANIVLPELPKIRLLTTSWWVKD